jgi:hypothetical protein
MTGGRKSDDETYQWQQQQQQSDSHRSVVILHLQILNINKGTSCLSFEVPQLCALVVALAVTRSRKYKLDIYIIIIIKSCYPCIISTNTRIKSNSERPNDSSQLDVCALTEVITTKDLELQMMHTFLNEILL